MNNVCFEKIVIISGGDCLTCMCADLLLGRFEPEGVAGPATDGAKLLLKAANARLNYHIYQSQEAEEGGEE